MLRKRLSFPIFAIFLQAAFLMVFILKLEYDDSAKPNEHQETKVGSTYPMFQDVHVMIFVGFGFLMTFLKRYGYTAVGVNLFIAAFAIQWAIIIRSALFNSWTIGIMEMLTGDFAAATILISFGAVLGKTSPFQLLLMAVIEVPLAQINEMIGVYMLKVADVGGSMFIHAFGPYFGLAVALMIFSDDRENKHQTSEYHSDLFSMIGTVFLWIYWPSFNGGAVSGDEQHRAVINTYLSLLSCTLVTFAMSAIVDKKGKFDMVHIQNATLAGGVAVGTTANMPIQPWGAVLLGSLAGCLSTLGYKYTPVCKCCSTAVPCCCNCCSIIREKKWLINDTCGVNNLHGMPGILAALSGALVAGLATFDSWGTSLFEIFPGMAPMMNMTAHNANLNQTIMTMPKWPLGEGRTSGEQALYQIVALVVTLLIAIVGGIITGLILQLVKCANLGSVDMFDDEEHWNLPSNGDHSVAIMNEGTPLTRTEQLIANEKEEDCNLVLK